MEKFLSSENVKKAEKNTNSHHQDHLGLSFHDLQNSFCIINAFFSEMLGPGLCLFYYAQNSTLHPTEL